MRLLNKSGGIKKSITKVVFRTVFPCTDKTLIETYTRDGEDMWEQTYENKTYGKSLVHENTSYLDEKLAVTYIQCSLETSDDMSVTRRVPCGK